MKKAVLFLVLLLLSATGTVFAQIIHPQEFVSELSTPVNGAKVNVNASASLSGMLNRPKSIDGKMVEGYRVYIFLDNSQNAREKGQQSMSKFRAAFPDIPVEISYENPYWKVSAGNCLSKDEAMIVFGRVKSQFTSAYIRKENLPMKNFLHQQMVSHDEDSEESKTE